MPIDFPNSPTVNQEFTANGVTWKYDGTAWNVVSGGSGFRVSSGAPSSPALGDLWYDTESGEMFIYYDSAWVSPSVVASVIASVKVSDTPPTNPAVGDIWFDSSNGDMTIYYDSQWVSPSVAASLATASASTITGTNSEGTSTSFARADHDHQIQAVEAFSAYLNDANFTISGSDTPTKVKFDAEEFDTSNRFDSTTNWHYNPKKAGKYFLCGGVAFNQAVTGLGSAVQIWIYKNGTANKRIVFTREPGAYSDAHYGGAIVEANGTNDYFELWVAYGRTGTSTLVTGAVQTYFQGYLIGS